MWRRRRDPAGRGSGRQAHDRALDGSLRLYPARLMGDSAGSAEMLGWMVYEHGIEPHVTVFDKSAARTAPSRATTSPTITSRTSTAVPAARCCARPERSSTTARRCSTRRFNANALDASQAQVLSEHTARKIPRSIHEGARDMARQIARSWEGGHVSTAAQEGRDAVRPPQTHPQARSAATERTDRRSRRVPARSHRPEPQETGEAGPDTEPQACLRSRQDYRGASEDGDPLDLLCSIAGLVQQNRSKCDLRRGARQVCSRP